MNRSGPHLIGLSFLVLVALLAACGQARGRTKGRGNGPALDASPMADGAVAVPDGAPAILDSGSAFPAADAGPVGSTLDAGLDSDGAVGDAGGHGALDAGGGVIDGGAHGADSGSDCRRDGCGSLQYCHEADGTCRPGCARPAQCTADFQTCDTVTHACVCAMNYHDCGMDGCVANGDVDHCGGRCVPCPARARAVATCDGSSCGYRCNAGTRDCGGNCAVCPSGSEVLATGCFETSCVATSCRSGFVPCTSGCCAIAGWQFETVYALSGGRSSLLLDTAGNPSVAYDSESPRGVYYAVRSGSSWSRETVDASTNAFHPSLVNHGGTPTIVYNGGATGEALYWGRRTSPGYWGATLAVSLNGRYPAAVVDGTNMLHFSYTASGSPPLLIHYERALGASSFSGGTAAVTDTTRQAIAANPLTAHVGMLFGDSSAGLRFVERVPGGAFSTSTISANDVWRMAIEIGPSSTIHVAYYDHDLGAIRYAYRSGGSWSFETIDAGGGPPPGTTHFTGVDVALGRGPDDVHVSYLDYTRGTVLRYAHRSSGRWTSETVADCDNVLSNTSIAVDAHGNPHITYPGPVGTWGQLRYAVHR